MRRKSKAPFLLLAFFVIVGIVLLNLINMMNVDNLSEKERSTRIIWLHLKSCRQPIHLSKKYGEGTFSVKCANNKAYLLVAHEHCDPPYNALSAYCWTVEALDPKTLELKP
jgi:hypothetical protein